MNIITGIFKESLLLLNKMAPYLVFGYLFAGVLHIFVKTETVSRHLGKSSLGSVVKASLFGIPLPLCSCSVIPAAMSLRKEGASRGAVLSFHAADKAIELVHKRDNGFNLDKGSWTSDRSWIKGYKEVPLKFQISIRNRIR